MSNSKSLMLVFLCVLLSASTLICCLLVVRDSAGKVNVVITSSPFYDGAPPKAGTPSHLADVLFIHGLDGDHVDTWRNPAGSLWPEWLATDLEWARIWALQYDAAAFRWGGAGNSIIERSVDALSELRFHGFGDRPLCIVSYSLGGLLAKQVYRRSSWDTEFESIFESIAGMEFIATPHDGSDYANTIASFGFANPVLHDLRRAPFLSDLSRWYQKHSYKLPHLILVEGDRTGPSFVVSPYQNVSIDASPVVLEGKNHKTISRADSRQDRLYRESIRFITESCGGQIDLTCEINGTFPPYTIVEIDEVNASVMNSRFKTTLFNITQFEPELRCGDGHAVRASAHVLKPPSCQFFFTCE